MAGDRTQNMTLETIKRGTDYPAYVPSISTSLTTGISSTFCHYPQIKLISDTGLFFFFFFKHISILKF